MVKEEDSGNYSPTVSWVLDILEKKDRRKNNIFRRLFLCLGCYITVIINSARNENVTSKELKDRLGAKTIYCVFLIKLLVLMTKPFWSTTNALSPLGGIWGRRIKSGVMAHMWRLANFFLLWQWLYDFIVTITTKTTTTPSLWIRKRFTLMPRPDEELKEDIVRPYGVS